MQRNIEVTELLDYYDEEKGELDLSNIYPTLADIEEIISFLSFRPEIKTLKVNSGNISEEGAKALAASTNFKTLDVVNECYSSSNKVAKILAETSPLKRANYGIEVGFQTQVPSLVQLCLFKTKQFKQSGRIDIKQNQLPADLHEKLQINEESPDVSSRDELKIMMGVMMHHYFTSSFTSFAQKSYWASKEKDQTRFEGSVNLPKKSML